MQRKCGLVRVSSIVLHHFVQPFGAFVRVFNEKKKKKKRKKEKEQDRAKKNKKQNKNRRKRIRTGMGSWKREGKKKKNKKKKKHTQCISKNKSKVDREGMIHKFKREKEVKDIGLNSTNYKQEAQSCVVCFLLFFSAFAQRVRLVL